MLEGFCNLDNSLDIYFYKHGQFMYICCCHPPNFCVNPHLELPATTCEIEPIINPSLWAESSCFLLSGTICNYLIGQLI